MRGEYRYLIDIIDEAMMRNMLTTPEQTSVSASLGCSDGRFNAPLENRKAGETARTLHHSLHFTLRPGFPAAVLLRIKRLWVQTAKHPTGRSGRFLTSNFCAFTRPIHNDTLVPELLIVN